MPYKSKEKQGEYGREYYLKHREERLRYRRQYQQAHQEQCLCYNRQYRQINKEKLKQYSACRRADSEYREKQAEYYRRWYAERGRNRADNYADVISLWRGEHPESVNAMAMVRQAIGAGRLVKPMKCDLCGGEGRISGHHEDYSLPYEVLWVCSSCHKKIHSGQLDLTT